MYHAITSDSSSGNSILWSVVGNITESDPLLTKTGGGQLTCLCVTVCVCVLFKSSHTLAVCMAFCLLRLIFDFLHLLVCCYWRRMRRFSVQIRPLGPSPAPHPSNQHPFTGFQMRIPRCGISAAPVRCRPFQPQTAKPVSVRRGLKPPPLPVQLNANIHQSPLHSPAFIISFMCSRLPHCCLN